MGQLRDNMVRDLEVRGLMPITRNSYLRAAERFATHFHRSPTDMGSEDVKAFLAHLLALGQSRSTVSVYRAGLAFLYQVTLQRPEVMTGVPRPKVPRRKPRAPTGSEVLSLIGALPSKKHKAIAALLYACGLRVSEACALRIEDIDGARSRIVIRQAKGQKDRYVPLCDTLRATLREYWKLYRPRGAYLFPGRKEHTHLHRRSFSRVLERASDELGLSPRMTPHSLRRAFATHMIELGADMRVVQIIMGHACFKSTQHYVTISERLLGSLVSPIDALGTPDGKILG